MATCKACHRPIWDGVQDWSAFFSTLHPDWQREAKDDCGDEHSWGFRGVHYPIGQICEWCVDHSVVDDLDPSLKPLSDQDMGIIPLF